MKLMVKILFLLLIVSACSKINDIRPINSDIVIEMREILEDGKLSFQFHCNTKEIYSCMNFQIDRKFTKKSYQVSIRFRNVIDPGFCLTALGPATTMINFGNLNEGVYSLDVHVVQSKSSGHLIVTNDQFIIEIDKKNQLEFENTVLNRVPENTIWGTVGYHTSATEPIVDEFIGVLQSAGASAREYRPGNYWHFTIDQNGNIESPQNHGYYLIRPFIFEYSGDSGELENVVKSFGQQHNEYLKIILYTAHGETFRSWMQ